MLAFLSTIRKFYQYWYFKKCDNRLKTNCIWLSEYKVQTHTHNQWWWWRWPQHFRHWNISENYWQKSPKTNENIQHLFNMLLFKCNAMQWHRYCNIFKKCCYLLIAIPGIWRWIDFWSIFSFRFCFGMTFASALLWWTLFILWICYNRPLDYVYKFKLNYQPDLQKSEDWKCIIVWDRFAVNIKSRAHK